MPPRIPSPKSRKIVPFKRSLSNKKTRAEVLSIITGLKREGKSRQDIKTILKENGIPFLLKEFDEQDAYSLGNKWKVMRRRNAGKK